MAKRPSILGKQQNGTGLWARVNNFCAHSQCILFRSGAVLAFERVPEVRNIPILLQLPEKLREFASKASKRLSDMLLYSLKG
jgi:hypothetical protein